MIRLVIVDDEPLVREGICNLIRSRENDYEIVADCYSGEDALKVVQRTKVDIIITDIKMTKMSGIKLIEETKKIAPAISFVILSAFSDFEFVRNSFQLGVEDYIIKTEISYERIISVLDKIKEKIISQEADYFKEIIKDTLLKKLIGGNHDKEALEDLKQYKFELDLNSLKIMFVKINDFDNYIQNEFDFDEVLVIYGIKNIMLEILKETKTEYEILYKNNGEFIVFCSFENILSEKQRTDSLMSVCLQLKTAIFKYLNRSIAVGISGYYKNKMQDNLFQAMTACEMNFVCGSVVFYSSNFDRNNHQNLTKYISQINNILHDISLGYSDFNFEMPAISLEKVTKSDVVYLKNMYEQYFYNLLEYTKKENMYEYFTGEMDYYSGYLKKWGTMPETHEWFEKMLGKMVDLSLLNQKLSQRIIRYILSNYQTSISLNEIAQSLNMNPNYISRIFKKEMGMGFSEYLIKVRIEKSLELIKENKYNIAQISLMVGFNNVEHFSRSFKKIMKKSPKNFFKTSEYYK